MKKHIGVGELILGAREKKYINAVIKSNRLSYGPFSEKFERGFARAHNCKFAVFCNSGTSALHIALAALKERHGWSDGDEVIVPAVTFIATSNIVLHNRMAPVFADVDPVTYNINPALIERHITPRTRAIIPVHLFGLPCDMDAVMEIARRHDLKVIEDSCETLFASYNGKKVGSIGDVGCFSTYVAHYIVTGVGGLATTNDPDLHIRLRSLMNHGRDSIYLKIDDDEGKTGKELHEIVAKRFNFISLGHSFRCTEFEAAIGLAQLEVKERIIKARKGNARILIDGLTELEQHIQLPTIPAGREHMFMMFPIVLRSEPKGNLVNYLEDRGIETRDLMPVVNQPIYKELFGDIENRFPIAQWINRGGFYVGCHQYLTLSDLRYIINAIRAYFQKER